MSIHPDDRKVPWNIGKIPVKGKLVLAPMTRVTDLPFRLLCRAEGASLAFTEMVNVNAVSRGNRAARLNYFTAVDDRPLGIQLFGTQPVKFVATAQMIEEFLSSRDGVFLDVNLDCPDEEVIKQGAGAALLKRPERVSAIIRALVAAQSMPVTVKMRLTAVDATLAVKTARIIESAGASSLTVHARTISQKNGGEAQWEIIEAIKDALSIPVIGNGGVNSSRRVVDAVKASHCDAMMIGKAAIYNPGIFSVARYDAERSGPELVQERLKWLRVYLDRAIQHDCLKDSRLVQRAKDFLRDFLPDATINKIKANATDGPDFIERLTERVTGLPN